MSKLRRRDLRRTEEELGHVVNMIADHGARLVEIRRDLARLPLSPEVDRLEALLGGVKVALERMGGNVLPGVVADVHALRDQVAEFRRELSGYRGALMRLTRWLDTISPETADDPPAAWLKDKARRKRVYNRRKKSNAEDKPQVEISSLDVAPHNGIDEEEPVKP